MGIKIDMVTGKIRESDGVWSWVALLASWSWEPNWRITPTKAGDEYLDTDTWKKRYAQWTTNSSWVEYSYTQDL